MRKNIFADNSRVENTIILMEKLSFSLKLVSGHFYGQSFIKTVRGPLFKLWPWGQKMRPPWRSLVLCIGYIENTLKICVSDNKTHKFLIFGM